MSFLLRFINNELIILSFGIFILSVYINVLSPSIAGGDSGEIVAEGCHLGIAHPPGYPLLTLLIYAIKYVFNDYKNIAYLVNISSAVFTSIACTFIGLIISSISSSVYGSLLGMGLFGFSPLIWQYAVTAEVFPLNTMLATVIIYLVVHYTKYSNISTVYIGAFVCGLGICNQHTIILYEIPLILYIVIQIINKIYINPIIIFYISLSFLLGILPYIYLPISAIYFPKDGSWGDLTTFNGFIHHFLRKDYGTFQLFSGKVDNTNENMIQRLEYYYNDIENVQGFQFVTIFTITTGLFFIIRYLYLYTNSRINIYQCILPVFLISTFSFYMLVFHYLSNLPLSDKLLYGVHQRFWMQPNILLFVFVGIGYNFIHHTVVFTIKYVETYMSTSPDRTVSKESNNNITTKLKKLKLKSKQPNLPIEGSIDKTKETNELSNQITNRKLFNIISYLTNLVFLVIAFYSIYMQYYRHIYMSNQSSNYYFNNYAKSILSPLPINSILLVNYDMQWTSIRYIQKCEGYRNDVVTINLSMMTYLWFSSKSKIYEDLFDVIIPGKFLSSSKNKKSLSVGAYTLKQFIDINSKKYSVYLSGKLSFNDDDLLSTYELMPHGLTSKFHLHSVIPNATNYSKMNNRSWRNITNILTRLPEIDKYQEITWEWTIRRDYKDRLIETAAFLLDSSIKTSSVDPKPLLESIYYLESAIITECNGNITLYNSNDLSFVSAGLLKNTGLAHVHLVQSKYYNKKDKLPKLKHDLFNTSQYIWPNTSWAKWSGSQMLKYWKIFLDSPDGKKDKQYQTIKDIYDKVFKI